MVLVMTPVWKGRIFLHPFFCVFLGVSRRSGCSKVQLTVDCDYLVDVWVTLTIASMYGVYVPTFTTQANQSCR